MLPRALYRAVSGLPLVGISVNTSSDWGVNYLCIWQTEGVSDPLYDNSFHKTCKSIMWPRKGIKQRTRDASYSPRAQGLVRKVGNHTCCNSHNGGGGPLGTKHMVSPHKVITTISQCGKTIDDTLYLAANAVNLLTSK